MDDHGDKRAKLSSSSVSGHDGEDRMSSLPDDVLHLILLRLPSTAAAAQTSLLSRRWRRVWAHLPEISFPRPSDPARVQAALAAHAAPALRRLHVDASDLAPGATAACLRLAARRLSGELFFQITAPGSDDDVKEPAERGAAFEFPCFDKATKIRLRLGFLGLAPPPTGAFARLTALRLERVRLHGPCDLGDAVSSVRCPLLQELTIRDAYGLANLDLRSESLVSLDLRNLLDVERLAVVAPMLRVFMWFRLFPGREPTAADITAPGLETLEWRDAYDPSSIRLGEMARLQWLGPTPIAVHQRHVYRHNRACAQLLRRFAGISTLNLVLLCERFLAGFQYLMEDITTLPNVKILSVTLVSTGHIFGGSVCHLLRMCTGIRQLTLRLYDGLKDKTACVSGCICHEPSSWRTEDILLSSLREAELRNLRGDEHEIAFVMQLLSKWATALKLMRISFDPSVTVSEELCNHLLSLSRPETCMKIYLYREGNQVLYAPVD